MTLALLDKTLPPAIPEIMEKIAVAEARMRRTEHTLQVRTVHHFHAGVYARTAYIDANQAFSSVLIKIPTLIVVHGDCVVLAGNEWLELKGYHVIPALAGRKQIYVTFAPTQITMVFASDAMTVEEAEAEFTDEAESLWTRRAACRE
jgi:hypothetical protein